MQGISNLLSVLSVVGAALVNPLITAGTYLAVLGLQFATANFNVSDYLANITSGDTAVTIASVSQYSAIDSSSGSSVTQSVASTAAVASTTDCTTDSSGAQTCSVASNGTCGTYDSTSVCFYGDAQQMYDATTGEITGTLKEAVTDAVDIDVWHAARLSDAYKTSPAFLLFVTSDEMQSVIGSDVGAYACYMQVKSSSSLSTSVIANQLSVKQSEGDVCADLMIDTMGVASAAEIFAGQSGSLGFVVVSADPKASFTQEMVHELAHITDFKYSLSGENSVFAQYYSKISESYPQQLSSSAIEQKLQDETSCPASALLLANRTTTVTSIIQPYNIAASAAEVFAYSATTAIVDDITDQLNTWLKEVDDTTVRSGCRQSLVGLLNGHIEYTQNNSSSL